jgi:hypothetical protein
MADGRLRKPGQFFEIAGADTIAAASDLAAGEVCQDFEPGRIGECLEDPGERLEHGILVLIRGLVRLELDQCGTHGYQDTQHIDDCQYVFQGWHEIVHC